MRQLVSPATRKCRQVRYDPARAVAYGHSYQTFRSGKLVMQACVERTPPTAQYATRQSVLLLYMKCKTIKCFFELDFLLLFTGQEKYLNFKLYIQKEFKRLNNDMIEHQE